MVTSSLNDSLLSHISINLFNNSATDIVLVSGTSAEVVGYIDVPLLIAELDVAPPLLFVTNSFILFSNRNGCVTVVRRKDVARKRRAVYSLARAFVTYLMSSEFFRIPRITVRLLLHV